MPGTSRSRSSRGWSRCCGTRQPPPQNGRRRPGRPTRPAAPCSKGAEVDLSRSSPDFARKAERAIRDWQGAVLDLVADEGMSKRSKARFFALGVNGIGVALMIVVFAHTGGLVGAEIGVAGGTAVLAQRVLEAVFGDQAIRRLAQTAKDDLDARVQALLADELLRYHLILNGLGVESDQAERLRQAARAVESARAAGLPTSVAEDAALPPAERRLAIDAPTVTQIPAGEASDGSDIVDAELVDQPGEELR